jgi:enterochelin esterase-like enzyme
MRLIFFALCALLMLAARPSSSQDCPETESSVTRESFRSERLGRDVMVSVVLPPCADDHAPLPYVILLHGSNKDDRHWVDLDVAAKLDIGLTDETLIPMAIVMPFGGDEANQNTFGDRSWGEALMHDVIPAVEAAYPLDAGNKAIGGISRGGFWAYHVALRYPEQFKAVGGHSGFFDANHAPDEYNPLDLALTVQNPPALTIDRGIDDYAAPGLDMMDARLNRAGVPHTYIIHPAGEHNDAYWSAHVGEYLAFYAEHLREAEQAPTLFATNTPPPQQGVGYALYVPVAAFPSRTFNLTREQFDAVLAGNHDPKLTITQATRDALLTYNKPLHPDILTVENDAALNNDLYRDRTRWSIVPWDAMTTRLRVLWIDEQHPLYALDTYPLAMASYTPNFDPDKLTTVMLSGVTAMARRVVGSLDENGVDWAAEAIAPYTQRADLFHISNEVSVVPECPAGGTERFGGGNSMCTKPGHIDVLDRLGVDVVELSGNHNSDYGYEAYSETLKLYHERGYTTIGGGETLDEARAPLIFEHNGSSIAWLSCNLAGPYYAQVAESRPGAAPCEREWLRSTLPQLKIANDVVILSLQYWEFDQYPPTAQQRIDFASYAEYGADVVIGTQAHFPQTYNIVSGYGGEPAFVHYGIGNFIFDQPWWAGVRFSLDELYIYDGKLMTVAVYPGIIEEHARPRLMTAEERDNFLYVLMIQNGEF